MYYIFLILVVLFLFVFLKLILQNNSLKKEHKITILQVKQNIYSIEEKQTEIIDKVLLNKSYTIDFNAEIKELSKEVLELHQDFIKEYAK